VKRTVCLEVVVIRTVEVAVKRKVCLEVVVKKAGYLEVLVKIDRM